VSTATRERGQPDPDRRVPACARRNRHCAGLARAMERLLGTGQVGATETQIALESPPNGRKMSTLGGRKREEAYREVSTEGDEDTSSPSPT
jgi:hypothetical protein